MEICNLLYKKTDQSDIIMFLKRISHENKVYDNPRNYIS